MNRPTEKQEARAIAIIKQIEELLPELGSNCNYHSPAMKEAFAQLQHTIVDWELELVFNQPLTNEEVENRKVISELVARIREGKIEINLNGTEPDSTSK